MATTHVEKVVLSLVFFSALNFVFDFIFDPHATIYALN